jgi:hypothetical protein
VVVSVRKEAGGRGVVAPLTFNAEEVVLRIMGKGSGGTPSMCGLGINVPRLGAVLTSVVEEISELLHCHRCHCVPNVL